MGLFDMFEEPSREFLEGQALRDNPELLKMVIREYQARQMAPVIDQSYGRAATPQESMQVNRPMEGPLLPGQERPDMAYNQITQEAQPGTGLIGATQDPAQQAILEMQRTLGTSGLPQGLKQQAALLQAYQGSDMSNRGQMARTMAADPGYKNVRYDEGTGRSFGLKDGRMQQIPGRSGTPEPIGAGGMDIKDRIAAENTLRDDFNVASKNYDEIDRRYDIVKNTTNDHVGDLTLITSYMKILDPTSTVNQGEQATAQNAGGVPSYITNVYNNLLGTGGSLRDDIRADFRREAEKMHKSAYNKYKRQYKGFENAAKNYGINKDNIFMGRTLTGDVPAGLPPGTISNGDGTYTAPNGRRIIRKNTLYHRGRPVDGYLKRN